MNYIQQGRDGFCKRSSLNDFLYRVFSDHHLLIFVLVLWGFGVPQLSSQNSFMHFAGGDDYVQIPNGGGLNNLQSGTIEMWVNWQGNTQDPGFSGSYGVVMARQLDNVFSNQVIGLDGADPATAKIIWRPYSAFHTQTVLRSAVSPGNGTWVHIAITFSPGMHTMYLNGIESATAMATGNIRNSGVPLTIGGWMNHGASYSTSLIDEVRIWNSVRTEAEIKSTMNKELLGTENNLLTYLNFNQGICGGDNSSIPAPQVTDITPNGNNGTMVNMAETGCTSNFVCVGQPCGFASTVIPTMSQWALFILGLCLITMGFVGILMKSQFSEPVK